jgi:hypothetical protein
MATRLGKNDLTQCQVARQMMIQPHGVKNRSDCRFGTWFTVTHGLIPSTNLNNVSLASEAKVTEQKALTCTWILSGLGG